MPEPPQALRFPEFSVRAGATFITAENVRVEGRLPCPVSLRVEGRTRLLVTGPNGAGKSTLLSVLAGELSPSIGQVHRSPNARVVLLRQESNLPLDLRADEVYTSHLGTLVEAGELASSQAVGLSSLGLLRPREASKRVGELSMGQRRRLDLALALGSRPHVLLLDEPSNHLSIALVDELTDALKATSAAVVLSTHDRQLLRDLDEWPQIVLEQFACARGM